MSFPSNERTNISVTIMEWDIPLCLGWMELDVRKWAEWEIGLFLDEEGKWVEQPLDQVIVSIAIFKLTQPLHIFLNFEHYFGYL